LNRRRLFLLVAVLFGVAAAVGAFALDEPVREALKAAHGKGWKKSPEAKFYGVVRKWGDWPWLMLGGGGALAVALARRDRRWTRILVAALLASTIAGIAANASRLTTGRTRPRASPEVAQGFYGPWHDGKLLIGQPKYNSFPSGHTATAFGFAWPIVLGSPLWGMVALAGAALVAWSSVALGAHHPSDVIVSVILSFLVGGVVFRWVFLRGDAVWELFRQRWRRKP